MQTYYWYGGMRSGDFRPKCAKCESPINKLLAYDTNILIYALEGTSPLAQAAQSIVKKGEHDGAVLSVLAWQELMTGAALRSKGLAEQLAAALSDLQATKFVPVNLAICEQAVNLTRRYGKALYGYDAVHIATALVYKAEAFVTNDKTLISLQPDELIIRSL
ncbi:MAG: type II toxin-antitoxin system VapC family toxin [Candidatus Saccharimonadales bacterium]